jgi:hypothetical protein
MNFKKYRTKIDRIWAEKVQDVLSKFNNQKQNFLQLVGKKDDLGVVVLGDQLKKETKF